MNLVVMMNASWMWVKRQHEIVIGMMYAILMWCKKQYELPFVMTDSIIMWAKKQPEVVKNYIQAFFEGPEGEGDRIADMIPPRITSLSQLLNNGKLDPIKDDVYSLENHASTQTPASIDQDSVLSLHHCDYCGKNDAVDQACVPFRRKKISRETLLNQQVVRILKLVTFFLDTLVADAERVRKWVLQLEKEHGCCLESPQTPQIGAITQIISEAKTKAGEQLDSIKHQYFFQEVLSNCSRTEDSALYRKESQEEILFRAKKSIRWIRAMYTKMYIAVEKELDGNDDD